MDTIDIMQGEVTVRTQDRTGQPVIVEFPDGQRVEVNIHPGGDGYAASVVVCCEPGQVVSVRAVDHNFVVLAPIVSDIVQSTVRFDGDVRFREDVARRDAAHVCGPRCGYEPSVGRNDGIAAYFAHYDGQSSCSTDVFVGPRAFYVAEEDHEHYVNAERAPLGAAAAYTSYVAGPFGSDAAAAAWLRYPDDQHLIASPGIGVMHAYREAQLVSLRAEIAAADSEP